MRGRQVWRRTRSMTVTSVIAVLIVLFAVVVTVAPLAGEAQQATSLPRVGGKASDRDDPHHHGVGR